MLYFISLRNKIEWISPCQHKATRQLGKLKIKPAVQEVCHLYEMLSMWKYILHDWAGNSVRVGFPGSSDGKESACKARDLGLIPGSGGAPGEGSGNPLQYSCLENSMDRRGRLCWVANSRTWLSDFHFIHLLSYINSNLAH